MKALTQDEVIALMRRRQGKRSAKDFATELGISAPYLSDIYNGKRDPGESVLEKLGLRKTALYVPVG